MSNIRPLSTEFTWGTGKGLVTLCPSAYSELKEEIDSAMGLNCFQISFIIVAPILTALIWTLPSFLSAFAPFHRKVIIYSLNSLYTVITIPLYGYLFFELVKSIQARNRIEKDMLTPDRPHLAKLLASGHARVKESKADLHGFRADNAVIGQTS